jgi:hypothetical protein
LFDTSGDDKLKSPTRNWPVPIRPYFSSFYTYYLIKKT